MIYRLYHFFGGYLTLTILTADPERVLDRCYRAGLRFWGLRSTADGGLCANFRKKDRPVLHDVLSRFSNNEQKSFEITERGLPAMLKKRKDRIGIFAGILFGIFLLWLSTFLVWSVTIVMDTTGYSEYEVLERLSEIGVGIGMRKSDLDESAAQIAFLDQNPEFVYAAFNLRGTRLSVELVERTVPPEEEKPGDCAHLVASRGGIVLGLEVSRGEPVVAIGDTVNEGDLLVSGAVSLREGGYRIVESRGKVFAQTFHEFSCEIPFEETCLTYTGNQCVKDELYVLGRALSIGSITRAVYEEESLLEETEQVRCFGYPLPLYRHTCTHYEKKSVTIRHGPDSAQKLAYDAYHTWLIDQLGEDGELISEAVSVTTDETALTLSAEVFLKENVAVSLPFSFQQIS